MSVRGKQVIVIEEDRLCTATAIVIIVSANDSQRTLGKFGQSKVVKSFEFVFEDALHPFYLPGVKIRFE